MKQKEAARQKKRKEASLSVTTAATAAVAAAATAVATLPPPAPTQAVEEEVQEVSDDDTEMQADINNEDDLLIPLTNGWVCEKRRDITVRGGYVTHYWSPKGDHFKSRADIQEHVDRHQLSVDMTAFDAADRVQGAARQGGCLDSVLHLACS